PAFRRAGAHVIVERPHVSAADDDVVAFVAVLRVRDFDGELRRLDVPQWIARRDFRDRLEIVFRWRRGDRPLERATAPRIVAGDLTVLATVPNIPEADDHADRLDDGAPRAHGVVDV